MNRIRFNEVVFVEQVNCAMMYKKRWRLGKKGKQRERRVGRRRGLGGISLSVPGITFLPVSDVLCTTLQP